MKLETKRLLIRNFKLEDLNDFYEYASMKDVGPRVGFEPYKDIESANKYLQKIINKPYYFAIELKEEKKVIGSIEIMDCKKERYNVEIDKNSKEIGACISSKYWNKGYMSEAISEIVRFSFEKLNLDSLYACNSSKNIGSSRIQEKCGFKIVGIVKDYDTWVDGTIDDEIERKITKEEYYRNNYELKNNQKNTNMFNAKTRR